MRENNFDVNLVEMSDVLNNKTLKYRINGFAYACKMNNIEVPTNLTLEDGEFISENVGVLSKSNDSMEENHVPNYFIAVNKSVSPVGKSVTFSGQYDDLTFTFINYYNKEKLDKKIVDLPFSISLEKKVDNDTYKFDIETDEGIRTKFVITKYREFKNRTLYDDVVFYANILDFSKILKLVKSFVFNPILVFNTYNEIDQKYKRVYTNGDLDKAIMQDENLDKPMSKIKKIMQRIKKCD